MKQFNLSKEPVIYQIQTRIKQLEFFYSRSMVEGVISSGSLVHGPLKIVMMHSSKASMPKWVSDWNGNSEVFRMHINNLFLTYDVAIVKQAFTLLGYNSKSLDKLIKNNFKKVA